MVTSIFFKLTVYHKVIQMKFRISPLDNLRLHEGEKTNLILLSNCAK